MPVAMGDLPVIEDVTPVIVGTIEDVTPTDLVEPETKHPKRGVRKRLLGDGEGDVCIYVISEGEQGIPRGALLPIEGIPRFTNLANAKKWLRQESGDLLANRQIIIFRAQELISVVATVATKVDFVAKVRSPVVPTQERRDST